MAKVHFKETTDNSFFGNFLYPQVLPSNHFLVKLKGGGVLPYEQIFTKVIKIAADKKIVFGDIQIIDSSHTPANVNIFKDKERKENEGKPPRDPDARWGVKHLKEATTREGKES